GGGVGGGLSIGVCGVGVGGGLGGGVRIGEDGWERAIRVHFSDGPALTEAHCEGLHTDPAYAGLYSGSIDDPLLYPVLRGPPRDSSVCWHSSEQMVISRCSSRHSVDSPQLAQMRDSDARYSRRSVAWVPGRTSGYFRSNCIIAPR